MSGLCAFSCAKVEISLHCNKSNIAPCLCVGTIFAYGQTGTGKTYTMAGVPGVSELSGIIPNSFAHIFGHIAKCEGEVR